MTFPSFRSITGGSNSNSTAPSFTLPATISAGDAILILSTVDSTGALSGVTGFTSLDQQSANLFQINVLGKVADGTEGGTSVSGTINATEATTYISIAVRDWSGTLADLAFSLVSSGDAGSPVDPNAVTAPWGAADNLFVAVGIGDYWDRVATGWPTGYTDNQTTQQHADQFGGTQCVNLATKNSAAASDDPSAFTIPTTTTDDWGALTFVIKPGGSGTITDVDGDNAVDQYQLVNANGVAGLSGPVTSGTLGGAAVTIVDGDWQTNAGVVSLRVPGSLDTGTYTLSLSDGTDSAMLSGVSYTQNYPVNLPSGGWDSNSIGADQGLGVGYDGSAYADNPGAPYQIDGPGGAAVPAGAVMTFKAPVTSWADAPIQNDINDYLAAPEDFEGWFRQDFTRIYSDGTTAAWSFETHVLPAPAMVSIDVPIDGTYGLAAVLQFTVNTDYPAYVTGSERLALDFEGATKYANYVSGDGTTALVFERTVASGDYAPNGIGVTALDLNGGTFANEAGQAGDLTLVGVPATAGIVAGTAPHLAVAVDSKTIGGTTATIDISYPGANLTGYEYSLDGGAYTATTNPIQLTGLTGDTPYSLDIKPVNEFGSGSATNTQFTTDPTQDATPAAFSFTAQTGVALEQPATSNAITVTGVDAGVNVQASVSGAPSSKYRVSTDNGETWGGWTSTATNVRLNYQIQVQHDAAATHLTPTDTTLTVGGVSANFRSTTLADKISPTITLNEGDVDWVQGTPFVDPGYSAQDNAAGNITADVVVTGTIDENTLGPQTLSYFVEDGNGNSTTVTRTVTVVEGTGTQVAQFLLSPQRIKLSLA